MFPGEIRDGKFHFHHRPTFDEHLAGLPDGRYVLKVEKPKKRRSDNQHRYYFGVVIKALVEALREDAQMEPDEVHIALKDKYLKTERVGGIWKIRSTTELTTGEFEEYLLKIRTDAATGDLVGFPVDIPLPNE